MDTDVMDALGKSLGLKDISPVPCCICYKSVSYPGYLYQKELNICVCMACLVGLQFEYDWTVDEALGYIEHTYKHKELTE